MGEWLGSMCEAGIPAPEGSRQVIVEHLCADLE